MKKFILTSATLLVIGLTAFAGNGNDCGKKCEKKCDKKECAKDSKCEKKCDKTECKHNAKCEKDSKACASHCKGEKTAVAPETKTSNNK